MNSPFNELKNIVEVKCKCRAQGLRARKHLLSIFWNTLGAQTSHRRSSSTPRPLCSDHSLNWTPLPFSLPSGRKTTEGILKPPAQPTHQLNLGDLNQNYLGQDYPAEWALLKCLSHKILRYYKIGSLGVIFYPAVCTWTTLQWSSQLSSIHEIYLRRKDVRLHAILSPLLQQ